MGFPAGQADAVLKVFRWQVATSPDCYSADEALEAVIVAQRSPVKTKADCPLREVQPGSTSCRLTLEKRKLNSR